MRPPLGQASQNRLRSGARISSWVIVRNRCPRSAGAETASQRRTCDIGDDTRHVYSWLGVSDDIRAILPKESDDPGISDPEPCLDG